MGVWGKKQSGKRRKDLVPHHVNKPYQGLGVRGVVGAPLISFSVPVSKGGNLRRGEGWLQGFTKTRNKR